MKILMLTPYLPYPPASGGQIRTLNLLKYLNQNNEITLVALYKNDQEKKYLSHLKLYCKSVFLCKRPSNPWHLKIIFKSIFSRKPFLVIRNYSNEARQILEKLINEQNFDVIHAETFYIMPHIPKTNIPILLVEQTIEFKVYQHFVDSLPFIFKVIFSLDILKLKFWERYYWKKASLVGTVSEVDKKIIKELEPEIDPVIIPNGAGDEMFKKRLTPKKTIPFKILFQGNFAWLQNTEAANFLINKVYPVLKKTYPNISVIIAGQSAKNKIKKTNYPEIKIIDIKPDDIKLVKKIYQQSGLFVAPIFGPGGTRLKILAAMASGLPVVATKTGLEGLAVKDNKHVVIANTPEEFAEKIKLIFSNKKFYEEIRRNAYQLVKKIYNWQKISGKLEAVYKKIKRSL
ncbi:MAG: glycosyltransferase family 4 protein [Microgenomates group bacterium]|nr:glycosyltransferase family 4 protein [Microgenomates group bacterium]